LREDEKERKKGKTLKISCEQEKKIGEKMRECERKADFFLITKKIRDVDAFGEHNIAEIRPTHILISSLSPQRKEENAVRITPDTPVHFVCVCS